MSPPIYEVLLVALLVKLTLLIKTAGVVVPFKVAVRLKLLALPIKPPNIELPPVDVLLIVTVFNTS